MSDDERKQYEEELEGQSLDELLLNISKHRNQTEREVFIEAIEKAWKNKEYERDARNKAELQRKSKAVEIRANSAERALILSKIAIGIAVLALLVVFLSN